VRTKGRAPLVIITGGVGVGKSSLSENLARRLSEEYGVRAKNLSVGWWFRAFIGLVVSFYRVTDRPVGLQEHAKSYSGLDLVKIARRTSLTIGPGGAVSMGGSWPIAKPTDDEMRQLVSLYGGDQEIRRFTTTDIRAQITAEPDCVFVIDSRSGRYDYMPTGRRIIGLYLKASPEVAAARKGTTVENVIARDAADRQLPEGPLTDPHGLDDVLVTDNLTEEEVLEWALSVLHSENVF
jgi:cytidylate kinase